MAMSLANEIIYGRKDNVLRLLQQGADVNEIDEYGYTPLIEAAIANHTDIAELLLQHGAKPNERDVTGSSALHWAVDNYNMELVRLLLNHKADPNAYTLYSQPVLLKPLLRAQHDLKELLYSHGADLKFAQDYLNTKLIGHRFELVGRVDIVDHAGKFIEVDLEGFILEFTVNLIQESLINFKNNFAARKLREQFRNIQKMVDACQVASELLRFQHYLTDITHHVKRINKLLNRDFLLIPLGYEGHAITFVKMGSILAKCDRGENSKREPSIVIYQMGKPENCNNEFLLYLLYRKHDKKFIHEQINEYLELTPIDSFPLTTQITGNCSWANVEGSVVTMLYLIMAQDNLKNGYGNLPAKAEAFKIFSQWREWDKDLALHLCFESFYDANPARKASKAALLAAVLFQTCRYEDPKDQKRINKIMSVLTHPSYEYVLKSYFEVYGRTKEGQNLKQLIDIYGK